MKGERFFVNNFTRIIGYIYPTSTIHLYYTLSILKNSMQHIGEQNLFFSKTFILIKMLHTLKIFLSMFCSECMAAESNQDRQISK